MIFRQTIIIAPDGTRTEEVEGSNVVQLSDGSYYTVTEDELTDPDGNHYLLTGDSHQLEEGGDEVHEVTLSRYTPRYMSIEERESAWLEAHPDATDGDLAHFHSRLQAHLAGERRERTIHVDGVLLDWAEQAADDELLEVNVRLTEAIPFHLPKLGNAWFDTDPVFSLEQMEARLIAIEQRKTDTEASQAELVADLEALGADAYQPFWIVNGFRMEVTPEGLALLSTDERVARVQQLADMTPETDGETIRNKSQINQYLDEGFNGELGSGRSSVGDIFVGVIDGEIDTDHPAWLDCYGAGCKNRLVDAFEWNSGSMVWQTYTDTNPVDDHATQVAGQLIAHLGQGQDTGYPGYETAAQKARSGMTTESSFIAINWHGAGYERAIEKAVWENVDIVNMSSACVTNCTLCDVYDSHNAEVDLAFKDAIFFAKGAGNEGDVNTDCDQRTACEIAVPGTAAGAFTVGGYNNDASNLNQADLGSKSPRGQHDADEPAMIELVAVDGRNSTVAIPDNSYGSSGGGQSHAGPVVAGAAANLKHHLINVFGTTLANDVGNLYTLMLLMGDNQLEDGTFALAGDPHDECWGAGRLRMRMFKGTGMDAPWRRRIHSFVLEDGEEWVRNVNPSGGSNQDVPADAEWFKGAMWFYEPNLDDNAADLATVNFRICDSGGCYNSGTTDAGAQRLWLGSVVGGEEWQVKVNGIDVPDSEEAGWYYYNEPKRKVYVSYFYEDRDSDDGDGPPMDLDDPSNSDTGHW